MNQLKAWKQGKNVVLTVPGWERKHALIKVNALDHWGSPFFKPKTETS